MQLKSAQTGLKIAAATAALLLSVWNCSRTPSYVRINGLAQGSTYQITYAETGRNGSRTPYSPEEVTARVEAGFDRIDRSLSGYNKGSVLSRLNRNETDRTDTLFRELFRISCRLWEETEHRFDPSGAPLYDLWGFGFENRDRRERNAVDSILQYVGMDRFRLEGDRLYKERPECRLNFNAIAQGFTCDYIARILDSLAISDYLIEAGGEVYARGLNPAGKAWRIGIDRPEDGNLESGAHIQEILEISGKGLVTSGNYRKFYLEDGKKYAHTIDPVSGYPVRHNLLSATVLAENATLADAYATYCMVIGFDAAAEFLESRPDLEGCLIYDDNGQMISYLTPGLRREEQSE